MNDFEVKINAYIDQTKIKVYLLNSNKESFLRSFKVSRGTPKTSMIKKIVAIYGNKCDVLQIFLDCDITTAFINHNNPKPRTAYQTKQYARIEQRVKNLSLYLEKFTAKVYLAKTVQSSQCQYSKQPTNNPSNDYFNKREREHYGHNIIEINRGKILQRDKMTCYLCGLTVFTDPHIDHILPIGIGPQGYSNLACTHKECNIFKSNKLPNQLLSHQRENLEKKWFELNSQHWSDYID